MDHEREPKRMFKVIVAGGVALVSVGSLVGLSSCGSEESSSADGGGAAADASPHDGADAFPHEGADVGPLPPPPAPPPPPSDAGDAGDADAAFPPII